ncbi:hypothetical protein [Notoacmeibacter marinus]|uniref:hypothetical protein n=1 Tax=Notoacmeibacter marinus TaxID=1876515 RepID=UPI0013B05599|nr:hypothetical protein [Notoacmeibacter marinus]
MKRREPPSDRRRFPGTADTDVEKPVVEAGAMLPNRLTDASPASSDPQPKCASLDLFSADAIHRQLDRIVASDEFRQSRRLCAFLQFIVGETLAGRAATLKELVIAQEVFDRSHDFDPRDSSVVRVEAGRLRSRLEKFYKATGSDHELVVNLPKGSYVPVFRRTGERLSGKEDASTAGTAPAFAPTQDGRRISAILACTVRPGSEKLADDPGFASSPNAGTALLRSTVESTLPDFVGRIVASDDHAVIAEFQSASDAIGAAVAIQANVEDVVATWDTHAKMSASIGIHIDTLHFEGDNLHGPAVVEARHLMKLPELATIAISGTVYESLSMQDANRFHFLGSQLAADGQRRYRAYAMAPSANGHKSDDMPGSAPVETFTGPHLRDSSTPCGNLISASSRRIASLAPMTRRIGIRKQWLPIAALLASALAVALSVDAVRQPFTQAFAATFSADAEPSIAVFPLQEIGTPLAADAVSESLTAEIITELTGVEGLAVRSHAATQPYRGQMVDVQKFGGEMDVSYVLQGHVLKDNQLLHVMVELVDVTTGTNRWARSVDIPLTTDSDVMKAQKAAANEIRRNVVNALNQ